jgi:peptidoglycan hydrolase CwlO-like protein
MSQVLDQETLQSDEYYQQEVRRMLNEMRKKNKKMERDQKEIDDLKAHSAKTLKQIDIKLLEIERLLA